MGNQASSELDGTIEKIIDLKNKPGLLKVELNKFVQQVPLDHTHADLRVDKKLFDILMNLIALELKQPGSPDIHIIMMTLQRLLRVKGFYSAIPRCSIVPLISALQHKDAAVVLSSLTALAWLLDCRVATTDKDKKWEKPIQETAAKQAFYESKGYEVLIDRVLIRFTKTGNHAVVSKVVDLLALDLVDNCMTTRFVGIQKMLQLLTPHMDLMLALTSHADLSTRCYGSILLQGFLLHSSLSTTQNLQSKVLEEGHLLWYILFAVDGSNLPAGHPYSSGLYDKNLTELSRNLLGLLCAGNPAIVEISVQKTIPKPLQVSLESLNADSATNTALSARSKQEKETIKNTLWNNFQSGRMKRVNIHPQFQRLDQETREPHILWTVSTKAELCSGLLKELDDLRLQKESRDVRWDYDGWEISYRSLNRYLRVGGFYISLLLPVLHDKNSSYVIEIERIHMLLAALFQRSVTEDDAGWKLACLRTMSALYEKYGDQLTRDLEILPYFAWLIDPKHTLPVYRDHILRMLQTLMKDPANVKRFVKSGGVSHLLYYISRVLTLPDTPAPTDKKVVKSRTAVKKKRVVESEDEEEEADERKEDGSGAASPTGEAEERDEDSKQNLLVGLPIALGVAETAMLCLNLLRAIQLAGPKMKRVMCEKDVIATLVRLLMSPVAGVKEEGTRLLLEILDHSTHLIPRLVTTGLFSFLVYGLRNGISPAVLELISKYHMRQDKSVVPAGESALTPYFPRALSDVLKTQGAEAFGQLFDAREAGGAGGSELIWNPSLRAHLFEVMTRRLGNFRALLVNDPFADYKFSQPEPIRYPSLESELCMAGVFLRQLNETGGVPALLAKVSIPNPEELMGELVRSLNARRFAGIDLLNILTAQVILIKAMPQLAEVQTYRAWDALFEILNNHTQEQEFPMIEKSAEIIHSLLSARPARDDEDENLYAFVDAKGVSLVTKTLEYFSGLKVNNVLIQRILIALLHCIYDIAWKQPELTSKDFGTSKKFLKRCVLEYLGRRTTTDHPMLSVVTCKTLMALSLSDRFQSILLETGTLLHLVDMAVFYRSAASEAAGNASAAQAKGMDEEKRVRLAASSVISVLAGYTTPAIHPEPNPQVQRVLSALLTPDLAKALQNPSGFVQRCTECRAALQPLYKYIEGELIAVTKSGEWPQKSWPFSPFFTLTKPRAPASQNRIPPSFRVAAHDNEYDPEAEPQEGFEDEQQEEEPELDGEAALQADMPDAYATLAPTRRLMSPADKVQAKLENLSSGIENSMSSARNSIGGAFSSLKNKLQNKPKQEASPVAVSKPNNGQLQRPASVAAPRGQPKVAAEAPPTVQKSASVTRTAAARGPVSKASAAVGTVVAGAAVGVAYAASKKQPPPAIVQYAEEEDVEAEDASSFYGTNERDPAGLVSPSTQHTPYGDAVSAEPEPYHHSEEPVQEEYAQEGQEEQQYDEQPYEQQEEQPYADQYAEQGQDYAESYEEPQHDAYAEPVYEEHHQAEEHHADHHGSTEYAEPHADGEYEEPAGGYSEEAPAEQYEDPNGTGSYDSYADGGEQYEDEENVAQ